MGTMKEPKRADHAVTVMFIVLTAMVFALDVLTQTGIAIWALYVLPIGFTRGSPVAHLAFIVAGACTPLIILGYVYSPPGASVDVAILNRVLGVLMVRITAFFQRPERI
jgi:hypothetical protein